MSFEVEQPTEMSSKSVEPLLGTGCNDAEWPEVHAVKERDNLNKHVFASCLIMFAGGFRATQLFPYAPAMTENLRGELAVQGFWTGLMLTAQPLGMLPTANLWAHAANSYGRRKCLIVGLLSNIFTLLLIATSKSYWMVVLLRFLAGTLDSTLSIMRTSLREAHQAARQDDTWGFSILSVSFGASSMAGPALGGLLYGYEPIPKPWECQPWMVPYMLTALIYVLAALFAYIWLPETLPLDKFGSTSSSKQGVPDKQVSSGLLRQTSFLLLMIMCGGHSYVYTGWELAFPLLARLPTQDGGEHTSPAAIGWTFLVGSVGLMIYTLSMYPKLVAQHSPLRVWKYSVALPVPVIIFFPRLVKALFSNASLHHSPALNLINYTSQLFVSVLLGSGFTSIQLLTNGYVDKLPNSAESLSLANGWLTFMQALVRAVSPCVTGLLFLVRNNPSPILSEEGSALPFDSLAAVLTICCWVSAIAFSKQSQA